MTISSRAASARESARKSDGKFGEQTHSNAHAMSVDMGLLAEEAPRMSAAMERQWRRAGFDPADAARYSLDGLTPQSASSWRESGEDPEKAWEELAEELWVDPAESYPF